MEFPSHNPSPDQCPLTDPRLAVMEQATAALTQALALLADVTAAYAKENAVSIACTVCGLWYPEAASDRLDICPACLTLNFPALQDLDRAPVPGDVSARQALDASLASAHQMTPRQCQAIRRIHERWEAEAARRVAGEEG